MQELKDREFEELANSIRHWENLRWVAMTVFMAAMAVAISNVFSKEKMDFNPTLLRLAGLLLVLVFWAQDERIAAYRNAFVARALDFEKENGITVFSASPSPGFISGNNAIRLLYSFFCLFWLFHLIDAFCLV